MKRNGSQGPTYFGDSTGEGPVEKWERLKKQTAVRGGFAGVAELKTRGLSSENNDAEETTSCSEVLRLGLRKKVRAPSEVIPQKKGYPQQGSLSDLHNNVTTAGNRWGGPGGI